MTNEEILKEILTDHDGYSENYDFYDSEYLKEIEDDEWTQDHKYQYRNAVYWSNKHNVYIQTFESRSGSYHSDWYYNEPDVYIVEKQEKVVTHTVTSWVQV